MSSKQGAKRKAANNPSKVIDLVEDTPSKVIDLVEDTPLEVIDLVDDSETEDVGTVPLSGDTRREVIDLVKDTEPPMVLSSKPGANMRKTTTDKGRGITQSTAESLCLICLGFLAGLQELSMPQLPQSLTVEVTVAGNRRLN
jgi:hypothetical protein